MVIAAGKPACIGIGLQRTSTVIDDGFPCPRRGRDKQRGGKNGLEGEEKSGAGRSEKRRAKSRAVSGFRRFIYDKCGGGGVNWMSLQTGRSCDSPAGEKKLPGGNNHGEPGRIIHHVHDAMQRKFTDQGAGIRSVRPASSLRGRSPWQFRYQVSGIRYQMKPSCNHRHCEGVARGNPVLPFSRLRRSRRLNRCLDCHVASLLAMTVWGSAPGFSLAPVGERVAEGRVRGLFLPARSAA
jgi:hypothetical protein